MLPFGPDLDRSMLRRLPALAPTMCAQWKLLRAIVRRDNRR
jgi:hypothetical protein